MYGRTCSSAMCDPALSGTGCRSWIMKQVATSGSSASARAIRSPSCPAANAAMICSSPAPYIWTTADTSSSATARVAGSPAASSRS